MQPSDGNSRKTMAFFMSETSEIRIFRDFAGFLREKDLKSDKSLSIKPPLSNYTLRPVLL